MRRIDTKIDGVNVIAETYSNFKEFITAQDSRPTVWINGCEPHRERRKYDFYGCDSYNDARDLLEHGYSQNVEQMVKRVGTLQKTGKVSKTKTFADVTGFAPIVPNAIIGVPNSMMNQKRVKVDSKVITVVYDPTCPWFTTPNEIMEYGCKVISYVMNLEKQGYRVRIEYMSANSDSDTAKGLKRQYVLRIPLKSEHNPINIKRLSFAMTHAAMLRYLTFDWMEHLPKSKRMSGMGYSLAVSSKKSRKVAESLLNSNEYLVYFGADLDTVFEQLK